MRAHAFSRVKCVDDFCDALFGNSASAFFADKPRIGAVGHRFDKSTAVGIDIGVLNVRQVHTLILPGSGLCPVPGDWG